MKQAAASFTRWLDGRLDTGVYARLPTLAALARRFGVSVPTVRAALRPYERDGRCRCVQGRGSFAGIPPLPAEDPAASQSSVEKLAGLLRRQIALGSLKTGGFLPLVKQTAITHRVTPATVIAAYRALVRLGLVSHAGRRYRVGAGAAAGADRRRDVVLLVPDRSAPADLLTGAELHQAFSEMEYELARHGLALGFRPARPGRAGARRRLAHCRQRPASPCPGHLGLRSRLAHHRLFCGTLSYRRRAGGKDAPGVHPAGGAVSAPDDDGRLTRFIRTAPRSACAGVNRRARRPD